MKQKTEEAREEAVRETEEIPEETAEEETAQPGKAAAEEGPVQAEEEGGKEAADAKVDELTDRLKRTMAEFDNYRKRTEKEKAARFDLGVRSVVEKVLPVLDNFERGLATLGEEQKKEPFAEGMEKTYRQMTEMLTGLGLAPIEAVGKPFDPDFHNAVMHEEREDAGENEVVEEFQKGYTLNGTVVRYSMVKVAN